MKNTSKIQGNHVDIIVQNMGGIRPMAQKLNMSVSTVQGWKQRKQIPEKYLSNIEEYFQENLQKSIYDISIPTPSIPTSKPPTPSKRNTHLIPTKPIKTLSILKNGIIMMCVSILSAFLVIASTPYWYPYIKAYIPIHTTDAQTLTDVSLIQQSISQMQKDIDVQSQNTRSLVADTQSQIYKVQSQLTTMQTNTEDQTTKISKTILDVKRDIQDFKQTHSPKKIYQTQWQLLYTIITSGEPYGEVLTTLTIPKTTDTKDAWNVVNLHKAGVVNTMQIKQDIDKVAFILAPKIAESTLSEKATALERIRTKLKHLMYITYTPTKNITPTPTLNTLYDAIDNDDMDTVIGILEPLNIPDVQGIIQKIQIRKQVLESLHTIWNTI